MGWYTAIFLGLIQGLAEFLPISSSGHLLMFSHFFGLKDGGLLFAIILHIATLLAVVVVYRKRLWQLVKKPFCKYNMLLLTSTIITCTFVVVFKDTIDKMFTIKALPFAFIVAGVVLLLPWLFKPKTNNKVWLQASLLGLAQGIAVIPGLTRSGVTITTAQLSGMEKTEAADFSFLMSIPVIIASLLFEVMSGSTVQNIGFLNISLAFVAAFVSGILAIKFMLNIIRKIDLRWFSLYLFILGIVLYCVGL